MTVPTRTCILECLEDLTKTVTVDVGDNREWRTVTKWKMRALSKMGSHNPLPGDEEHTCIKQAGFFAHCIKNTHLQNHEGICKLLQGLMIWAS